MIEKVGLATAQEQMSGKQAEKRTGAAAAEFAGRPQQVRRKTAARKPQPYD